MQSALDQFRVSITRVRDLISLHNSLNAQSTTALDLSDMLRSALVLGVSALDYYVHEVVTLGMLEIQRGQRLEPAPPRNSPQSSFSRFQVSLGGARQDRLKALDIASWLENDIAQTQGPAFLQQSYTVSSLLPAIATSLQNQLNNTAWLEDEIRKRLGYQSFQEPDKIADAIRLISDKKLWEEVANQMSKPQEYIKQQLSTIVQRRNQIAHEADIDPAYGIGSRRNIDAVEVTELVDFIEEIIEMIHQIL